MKTAKNTNLIDFLHGISPEHRLQLRQNRNTSKDCQTCLCHKDVTTIEIFAKNSTKDVDGYEIQVFDDCSDSPLSALTDDTSLNIHIIGSNSESVQTSASSLTSKKPLEWDNGADIGYSRDLAKCKSHSLPVLKAMKHSVDFLGRNHEIKNYGPASNRPTTTEKANIIGKKLTDIINRPCTHKNKMIQESSKKINAAIQTSLTNEASFVYQNVQQTLYSKELRNNLEIIEDLLKKCDIRTRKQSMYYLKNLLDSNCTKSSPSDNSNDVINTTTKKHKTTIYKITTELTDNSNSNSNSISSSNTNEIPKRSTNQIKKCCCHCRCRQKPRQSTDTTKSSSSKNSNDKTNNRKNRKPPIAYVMTFNENTNLLNRRQSDNELNHLRPSTYDLQEYLAKNRPDFVANAEQRRRDLIELMHAREKRKRMTGMYVLQCETISDKENSFATRDMRLSSYRKYKKLPEIQKRISEIQRSQEQQSNRILKHIFSKKIQHQVLKGKINATKNLPSKLTH